MIDFKDLLLKKKNELLASLELQKKSAEPVAPDVSIGRLSRMDAIQQQQISVNALARTKINLELIDQALKRICENTYGICLSCEEEISEKRLMARPETPFCQKCQK